MKGVLQVASKTEHMPSDSIDADAFGSYNVTLTSVMARHNSERTLSTAGTTSYQGRETEWSNWEEIAIIRIFTIFFSHALLLGLQLAVVLF